MIEVEKVRGYRNKNPMNIRDTLTIWKNEDLSNVDKSFEEFTCHSAGIRAGARVLMNYERLYGLNTVTGIISRYAPSSENHTIEYIESVCNDLGVKPNTVIDVEGRILDLTKAVIKMELGSIPYSDDFINDSIWSN